ncbi:MAG: hypothetical protein FWF94_03870, partial [Oscillospiraceae bacterium]|nr:hypothetical protein [Oscillospiraceae bacterium]
VRGSAGRRERGGHFLPHVTGFSHAANDDRPFAMENLIDCLKESGIELFRESMNGVSFSL